MPSKPKWSQTTYNKNKRPGKTNVCTPLQMEAAKEWASFRIRSKKKLAEFAGVSEQTINAWFKKDYFVGEIYKIKKDIISALPEKIELMSSFGIDILSEMADDPKASEQARVKAASKLAGLASQVQLSKGSGFDPSTVPVEEIRAALKAVASKGEENK